MKIESKEKDLADLSTENEELRIKNSSLEEKILQ